ncbi:hypothetical protein CC78DRAFT_613628 [Lojkania enalia]|uniref:Uncharacterized protein n=1 Tax=Lojkania enalia TaxID=147567 RepID=A0A9P4N818_9PLEO|nr:hypothetical protein CC78DRAFT_613628 [Didymosphaeria enalia]
MPMPSNLRALGSIYSIHTASASMLRYNGLHLPFSGADSRSTAAHGVLGRHCQNLTLPRRYFYGGMVGGRLPERDSFLSDHALSGTTQSYMLRLTAMLADVKEQSTRYGGPPHNWAQLVNCCGLDARYTSQQEITLGFDVRQLAAFRLTH